MDLERAHDHSFANRKEIEASNLVGCFDCKKIYPAKSIVEWSSDKPGDTAICAECGIDSVIGDASGIEISKEFLETMHEMWSEQTISFDQLTDRMRSLNNIKEVKKYILELCSESEHGSWEFWSDAKNKTDAEGYVIARAITELVNEGLICPTEKEFINNQSYNEVALDSDRLTQEVGFSIQQKSIDPNKFYWFIATNKGKKLDLKSRS